jgi:hypothetical protein
LVEPEESDDESSLDEHAVSATASPAAPTAANAVRRDGAVTGSNDSLVMLTFLPWKAFVGVQRVTRCGRPSFRRCRELGLIEIRRA